MDGRELNQEIDKAKLFGSEGFGSLNIGGRDCAIRIIKERTPNSFCVYTTTKLKLKNNWYHGDCLVEKLADLTLVGVSSRHREKATEAEELHSALVNMDILIEALVKLENAIEV